jgi:hypothetical protein
MTDEQLTELSVEELKDLYETAKCTRMTAAINNKWQKFQEQGELMLKCQQLIEFKSKQ